MASAHSLLGMYPARSISKILSTESKKNTIDRGLAWSNRVSDSDCVSLVPQQRNGVRITDWLGTIPPVAVSEPT